jgi:hypothetical protein
VAAYQVVAASPARPQLVVRLLRPLQPPPLDTFSRPLHIEDWHQQAIRKDQQAAGLLAPGPGGGHILHGFYACGERAYRDLWAYEQHYLVKEHAAHARQEEAACRT